MLVLCCLFAFTVTVNSRIILNKQHGERDQVKLQFIDNTLGGLRFRRASDTDFEMPEQLDFIVTVDDNEVEMLLDISDISIRPPLYEIINGQPVLHTVNDNLPERSALYQGVYNRASYMVTCTEPSAEQCLFEGSFYHEQSKFLMTPHESFNTSGLHEVQEVGEDQRTFGDDAPTPPESVQNENSQDRTRRSFQDDSQPRPKRDTTDTNVVELLAVTDESVYQTFFDSTGSESEAIAALQAYYALQINEIDLHYWSVSQVDPSLTIRVVSAGVVFAKTADAAPWSSNNTIIIKDISYLKGISALKSFTDWRNRQRSRFPKHDHAMAFTMKNYEIMKGNDTSTNGLAGLAWSSQICRSFDTSIIEDDFHRTANTAAHELGHSLGAKHDFGSDCPRTLLDIMTPVLYLTTKKDKAEAQYTFSYCSVSRFNAHIDGLRSNCMKDYSFNSSILDQPRTLPGEVFSIDQQCKMKKGDRFSSCVQLVPEAGCFWGIKCGKTCGGGGFRRYYPMAGTPCGNTGNKWCYRGLCRDKPTISLNVALPTSGTTAVPADNPCTRTCCKRKKNKCCMGMQCCKNKFRKLSCCEECRAFLGNK